MKVNIATHIKWDKKVKNRRLSFREKLALPFLNTVTHRLSGFELFSRYVIGSVARKPLSRLSADSRDFLLCSK